MLIYSTNITLFYKGGLKENSRKHELETWVWDWKNGSVFKSAG